jgi:hypothetical protein
MEHEPVNAALAVADTRKAAGMVAQHPEAAQKPSRLAQVTVSFPSYPYNLLI